MRAFVLSMALLCAGCRTDHPPQISIICIGDGLGGADCVLADGSRVFKAPSELKNYWMTTQTDQANFASWCFQTPKPTVKAEMNQIRAQIAGR